MKMRPKYRGREIFYLRRFFHHIHQNAQRLGQQGQSPKLKRKEKEIFLLIFFGLVIWCAMIGFFAQQDLLPTHLIMNKTSLLFKIVPENDIQQMILLNDDSAAYRKVTKKNDTEQKMTEDLLIGPKLQAIQNIKQCQHICKAKKIYLLNIVHSPVENIEQRMMIRESWGDIKSYEQITIETVFFIGMPRQLNLKDDIASEINDFGDIVQGDFVDTEENHLLKHFLGLQWVSVSCAHAQFVLTTEDNVIINTPNLMRYLRKKKKQQQNLLHCTYLYSSIEIPIHITNGNKIFTINYGRSNPTYPPFCMRMAYITSASSIKRLYHAGLKMSKSLLFDDVFITGILANRTNIRRTQISKEYHWQRYNDETTMLQLRGLIFVQMPQYWHFNRVRPLWSSIWIKIEALLYND